METEFFLNFNERKKKLFEEMGKQNVQEFYERKSSEIIEQQQFWLIIFSKETSPEKNEKGTGITFWVWDSLNNKKTGENIVRFDHNIETPKRDPIVSIIPYELEESYLNPEKKFVVLRPKKYATYLIFDFSGKLLFQTESHHERAKSDEFYYSKLLKEDLFFAKNGNNLHLYDLNIVNGISPKRITFCGISYLRFRDPQYNSPNIEFVRSKNFFLIYAWEHCPEAGHQKPCLVLFKIKPYETEEIPFADFVWKTTFEASLIRGIQLDESTNGVDISFQLGVGDTIHKKREHIIIPQCLV